MNGSQSTDAPLPAETSRPRSTWARIILGLTAVLFGLAGGLMMFYAFMFYDDEGYVLFSLRNFSEHGGLYRDIYSQYGPLPYALYYLLHLFGMPLTHTAGRLVTLAVWSITAYLSGTLVWRTTRSVACGVATVAAVFVYLWPMIKEPTHPGGLVAVFVAIAATWGCRSLEQSRTAAWAAVMGATVTALALTKINVAVFAGVSAGAFMLLHWPNMLARRYGPWLLLAGFTLLPFALMRGLLAAPWVRTFAILFSVSAIPLIATAAIAASRSEIRFRVRDLGPAALAAGAMLAAVLVIVMPRGTSVGELLDGIVVGPLRHPGVFNLRFPWPMPVLAGAAAACALFGAAWYLKRRGSAKLDPFVAALRIVAAAAIAVAVLQFPLEAPHQHVFAWASPWLWVFVWPLTSETPAGMAQRAWLGLLAFGQWLHAYPVPGSQIAWGTFLALPLALEGAHAGAMFFAGRVSALPLQRRLNVLGAATLVAFTGIVAFRIVRVGNQYWNSRPLALPGAENIRLPDGATATYRVLCTNAAAHADVLFSLPGSFSLNMWSGVPAPTLANTTHWFSLLDEPRQRAIVQSLEQHARACIVVQTEHVNFLRQHNLQPRGVLYDYIMQAFEPAFRIDDFEFRVHKGRRIAPFFTGELLQRPADAGASSSRPDDTLLQIPVVLPANRSIARIEIAKSDDRGSAPLVLDASNARLEVTPISLQGDPVAAPQPARFPLSVSRPTLLSIYFDHKTTKFSLRDTLVVLRDGDGAELALVRLRE